ncbi:MAG TPA: PhzF family phenazine biosynthesis protein [Bradyrhizobium sp.]|jgi:trans-2,3-dihydro-3-hydroxyanthranilate isomerase|uniref:PhzF family phenazine biosynthesis protein n=1 Tax=Bradyrhizobium sp. TaxID=376 RepID=UPI002CDC276B|nr:PhzF family phenazine biosynthesis protein [Bradyrhizobium sp.]HTB03090.1 PhzF family phenazine biosynthesis protein [Bradyrhizobium sp.]
MQRRYVTVDVFTDRAFGGNPLAVVLDAQGLSTSQMQAIATEFNYSETTFVLPPQDPAHDAQVRIFTVRHELPFAGHPNVGTAFVLATQAATPPARLLFEEKAGLVPVEILTEKGRVVAAELTAPQPLKRLTQLSGEQAAACLSLPASDVKTDRHPPQIASVGLPFLMVELASRDALRRAKPDAAAFAKTLPIDGNDAIYFYTREVPASEMPLDLQARMLHPGASGLCEDPATGSATAAAAALLADLATQRDGEFKLRIGQGVDMGRPSLLLTRVRKENGAVVSAHVGGACVEMMEGTFRLAGEG